MKRRFFSHYIYLEPAILLKNFIVEMDDERHIINLYPFEKEIERTEFYSGILVFVEDNQSSTQISLEKIKKIEPKREDFIFDIGKKYKMLHFEDFVK